jgi:hypothetical protein
MGRIPASERQTQARGGEKGTDVATPDEHDIVIVVKMRMMW